MSRIVDGKAYLDTTEVMKVFDASKKRFYDNIKPQLPLHTFDGKTKPWYAKGDVDALKMGKPIRNASISINGIFSDWVSHLESLGYNSETAVCSIDITPLPEDAVESLGLPSNKLFIKRERMSYASGKPICVWSTYYPTDIVGGILDRLKQGSSENVVEYIKSTQGLKIELTKERYTARITTFEEQARFNLTNEEAVIILQRAGYTKDKSELVLYSEMVLLGKWFVLDSEHEVDHWS